MIQPAQTRLALIIASYQYQDPDLRQLVAPAQDAEALARVLEDPAIGGFQVQTLLNQPSYKVNQVVETFFIDRKQNDLLLLYYSGHGIKDRDGRLYFATIDTRRKTLRTTAVPANLVNEMMRDSRSRRQVLLLDCCYSGAFAKGMVAKAGTGIGIGERFEGRGRIVLTASDAMQYAFEGDDVQGEGVRSVFTRVLVRGLETGEADLDRDGRISLDELYEYVHDRVTDETPQQRPGKWDFEVQGKIIIARNPRPIVKPAPKPAELPTDLQQAIKSATVWMREGAVSELERLLHGSDEGLILAARQALTLLADDDSRRVSAVAARALRTVTTPTPEPIPKAQKRLRRLLSSVPIWVWAVVAVVAVVLFIALSQLPFGRGATEEPTPAPTEAPTSIPTIELAMPTQVLAVETAESPTPTRTPTPTQTPTETPTQEPTPPPALAAGHPQTRPADDMVMVYVPGGTFQMGSAEGDSDADSDEFPQHTVTLDAFWIDQTEVTNAQYALCVTDGECDESTYANDSNYNGDDYPVVGVSWNDAAGYCAWAGAQLPTEAQWEYAARGPDGYIYPWGNDAPTCELAQFGTCPEDTIPVGSLLDGASWCDALDMAGNAWEWVADWWYNEYPSESQTNPTGPTDGSYKVLRGGSFSYYETRIRASDRYYGTPDARHNGVGFRCVGVAPGQ